MSSIPLPPATYIDTQAALESLVEQLHQTSLIAIDTESNSLYAYRERVCLIQLSTRATDYIIDPLAISDFSSFGELMASDHIEKVFHAAEYDITCMKRDFGFDFRNLFDTMVAARIAGFKSIGLASLLEASAGVRMDKRHQLDNWGERPLSEDSLTYAQMDTHFLPYLRDELHALLEAHGHLNEAREAFVDVCQTPAATPRHFDPNGFWKLGKPNRLKRRELMILREIYTERDHIAAKLDKPPFKIINNKALVAIARRGPEDSRELHDIRGISGAQVRRFGDALLKAVARGKAAKKLPKAPSLPMPDPIVTERYNALHTWRKARADRRGVESDVIVSKQTLWHLANKAPSTPDDLQEIVGLGPWRLETYGHEILDVLKTMGD